MSYLSRPSVWALGFLLLSGTVHATATARSNPGTPASPCTEGSEFAFELIDIDTLLYVENRGLTRVLIDLNGFKFKLVTDPEELAHSTNAFLIPRQGTRTMHIGRYILPGDGNCMEVRPQGPPGADADLIVGDLLLPGESVAYTVEGLIPLPDKFDLLQSYPNPFQGSTTLTFTIPEHRWTGSPTHLAIYDLMGRRVRVLVDAHHYPGRYTVQWDGTDGSGRPMASGVYFGRIVTDELQETIRLVHVR